MIERGVGGQITANLIVQNIEPAIVLALRQRAAQQGVSVQAAHRAILQRALLGSKKRSLHEVLAQIPDVGLDEDFERQ